ncbi:hypothetical protein FCL40_14090 [Ferrimonas sediminicola]|uniref:Uncharacterized protein n=1 Tax=Ferrimonas sediminicola TaxID=2569538 RepID=A0A4U1BBB3_9GAMM|nr:hypothetical protein [Ferrimonas sediminicola]TKB48051.1 hypothetical protein FCL40_14090 [Ferrimonas sediminicola]
MKVALGALALTALLLGGCASNSLFLPYPAQMGEVKAQLNRGQGQPLKPLEAGLQGQDRLLYAQEAGRVAQLQGDFDASRRYFDQALALYDQRDWIALVSLSDLTSQAAGATLSDNLIPYPGQAYERILVHQYQSLNYLLSGDLTGATVEARRADQAQTLALRAYEEREEIKTLRSAGLNRELARLASLGGNATHSFINGYTLYQNAVLFEAQGELNDALIDLRKALQAYPDNGLLAAEYVRLSCQLAIDCDDARRQFGAPSEVGAGQGRLVVLLETGYVPAKESVTLPFTIDGYYQQVSLPTYRGNQAVPARVELSLEGSERHRGEAQLIGEIDTLAIRALQEQYPAIVLRQALRVAAKAGTNQWAEKKGGEVGAIAMQIFNALTEQADRRSWLTLPHQAWMWPKAVAPGQYRLAIDGNPQPVEVRAGRTTLVWAVKAGPGIRMHSVIL